MSRQRRTQVIEARGGAGELEQSKALEACRACKYVLCICPVLRAHVATCQQRRAILAEIPPTPCAQHQVVACTTCNPCTCRHAPQAKAR